MQSEQDVFELKYDTYRNKSYSRLTLIPVDWDKDGMIHHFLLAFETIRQSLEDKSDAKEQVRLYYEQLKQAILENDSYVDAMLGMADVVYTVNLTKDILENNIKVNEKPEERTNFLWIIRCHVLIVITAVNIWRKSLKKQ